MTTIDENASPDHLTAAVRGEQLPTGPDIATPAAAESVSWRELNARLDAYRSEKPTLPALPSFEVAELDDWQALDAAVAEAMSAADDARDAATRADLADRAAAVAAVRAGEPIPKPTQPAALAAADVAFRRAAAVIEVAAGAARAVPDAMRAVWAAWRAELVADITTTTDTARAAVDAAEAALTARAGAVRSLLTVDAAYGYAKPGEVIVHQPPPGVHPAIWQPPRSQGMAAAAVLRDGQPQLQPACPSGAVAARSPRLPRPVPVERGVVTGPAE